MVLWGSFLFLIGTVSIVYSLLPFEWLVYKFIVAIFFACGSQLWIHALYNYRQDNLNWRMLKRKKGEALNLMPDTQKSIRTAHWILIIFLACNLLGVSMFLCRLLIFYNHGGERLLAHLAAYDIRLWEQDGSMNNRVSDLGYNYFDTGYCQSPESNWGCFQFTWNTLDIKKSRLTLQTPKENQQISHPQPDLYAVSSKDIKTKGTILTYYFFDKDGLFTWKSDKGGDMPSALVQEFLASLPAEKGKVSLSQRKDYYKSMVANDLIYFSELSENAVSGRVSIFFIVVIIPKTALQWLWLHLFALLPGNAMKFVLPAWVAVNILLIILVSKSLACRIKFMKKDTDEAI